MLTRLLAPLVRLGAPAPRRHRGPTPRPRAMRVPHPTTLYAGCKTPGVVWEEGPPEFRGVAEPRAD